MLYQLLHRLFGWDYVQWSNSCSHGVASVHVDGMGRPFFWRYKVTKVADLIINPDKEIWLTCSPAKYAPRPEA